MALIASHVRFALDVAQCFPIRDLSKYLTGTIYPDTRWKTCTDRSKTHHPKFCDPDFATSCFNRGWHVHCVYDELQSQFYRSIFTDSGQLSDLQRWILFTAAKMVQDQNDIKNISLPVKLDLKEHIQNPNGEDIQRIRDFYNVIRTTYQPGLPPSEEAYRVMWLSVGLDDLTTDKVITKMGEILQDDSLVSRIEMSYLKALHHFRQSS